MLVQSFAKKFMHVIVLKGNSFKYGHIKSKVQRNLAKVKVLIFVNLVSTVNVPTCLVCLSVAIIIYRQWL